MENIQNKSALIPSDEIRSEELLAEQKFEAFITSLAHIIEKYGMRVLGEVDAVFCIRGSAQRCKWTDTAWKVKKIC